MKRNSAVLLASLAGVCAVTGRTLAQVESSSSACVNFDCQSVSSTTLTSSASKTGSNAGDFASAHTGLVVTHPFNNYPRFAIQSGSSGLAASANPGSFVNAHARWGDTWRCDAPCGSVGPWWGRFDWVLHLSGVVDPILIGHHTEHGFISLSLTYSVPSSGYALGFSICYDSGPCDVTGAFAATLRTPSGDQDVTQNIVFGTNAAGQTTVSLDVELGTSFCLGDASCTWNDSFRADADVENTDETTHFIDFSGTFTAAAASLDPTNSWTSDGGQTAAISPALVVSTNSGRYLQPLTQSTDATNATINNIKNGRVIPVKVQLSQGGTAITAQNAPGPITIRLFGPLSCSTAAPPGDIGVYADAGQSNGGTNQYRYDVTAQAWIYNLDTRALGLSVGSCYRIDTLVNGTPIPNAFVIIRPTM